MYEVESLLYRWPAIVKNPLRVVEDGFLKSSMNAVEKKKE